MVDPGVGSRRQGPHIFLHDIIDRVDPAAVGARRLNMDALDAVETALECQGSAVALSVDDGYASVERLLPLLERYRVRCTVFITTGFMVGSHYPYEMELCHLLEQLDSFVTGNGERLALNTREDRDKMFFALHGVCKPLDSHDRERELQRIFRDNGAIRHECRRTRFLEAAQARELDNHPLVDIGSHSHSHLMLSAQQPGAVLRDLWQSRRVLERLLGHAVHKLSYPYGANSAATRMLARIAGYRVAYGTQGDMAAQPMNIPRVSLRDLDA